MVNASFLVRDTVNLAASGLDLVFDDVRNFLKLLVGVVCFARLHLLVDAHDGAACCNCGEGDCAPEADFVSNTETVGNILCCCRSGVIASIGTSVSAIQVTGNIVVLAAFCCNDVFVARNVKFVAFLLRSRGAFSRSFALEVNLYAVDKCDSGRCTRDVNELAIKVNLFCVITRLHAAANVKLGLNNVFVRGGRRNAQRCHGRNITDITDVKLIGVNAGFLSKLLTENDFSRRNRCCFINRNCVQFAVRGKNLIVRRDGIFCREISNIINSSECCCSGKAEGQ